MLRRLIETTSQFRKYRCIAASDVMGQEATHAPQQTALLFYYLVGVRKQLRRHIDGERLAEGGRYQRGRSGSSRICRKLRFSRDDVAGLAQTRLEQIAGVSPFAIAVQPNDVSTAARGFRSRPLRNP